MKMMKKRFLGILLSLALVLGMFPGMSLTAYAATSHGITINTAQHGTVTASVGGSTVTSAEESATVTLTANPESGYRLKSISGVYKDYYNESMGIGSSTAGSSANFSFSAEQCNYNGCRLYQGKKITISSSTKTITRVVFTVSGNGMSRNESQLVTSSGTKTVSGTGAGSTITISNLSTNSVSLTGNGSNTAQQWQCNRVVVYGKDISDTTLKVNNTSDPNIRTFTMPAVVQGNVTITAEFEEMPKYKVTLTGGANATTSGGNTTQTELTGAMEIVTYTANSGYKFPETSNLYKTTNGITVTRTSDAIVTVSGTPTANADVTVPDAVKPAQTITASDVTATYGDTDKSVIASVTNPAEGGGAISYAVKDGSADYIDVNATTGALTIKKVPASGKAYVIVKAAATDDYAETTKEVTVTISKAEATVAAKDQNIMVGGTVPDLSAPVLNTHYSVTGLVGTDALTTAPTLAYQKNGSAATPDNTTAGTYDIVPSGASAGDNYNISYTNGTLTITAKDTQTITAENVTATYGDTDKSVSATTDGNGTISYAVKDGSGDYISVASDGKLTINKVPAEGKAYVTVTAAETTTGGTGGNGYAAATKDVTVIISKATVTVAAENQSIYVNGTVPDLSAPVLDTHYTVSGLVGTDALTTAPTLAYQKDGSAATPDNTTAGTYDIVASGASAGDNYAISYTKGTLTISDKGIQTITADDVTATYGDTDKSVSASVTNPATGGGAISYAVKDGSADYIDVDATTGALNIKKVPADGKAYVVVTAAGTAAYEQATKDVTVTINKANSTVTKAPEAKTLTYNGSAQELVTAGTATGGEMQYALGNETEATEPYTTSIPAKTDVGTYYVWYKVKGDDGYSDTEAKCIEVTINSADASPAVSNKALSFTGQPQPLVNAGTVSGGTLEYALGTDANTAPTDGWSTEIPTGTEPGTYYVWYKVVGDENHNDVAPACIVVTITPAAAGTAPDSDYTLLASMKTSGNKAFKLKWTAVTGAEGYDVFFGDCGGGECTLEKTVTGTSCKIGKLKKGNAYKAFVKAWKTENGQKVYIGEASPDVHAVAGGKSNKYTNAKKISVKKKKLTVAVGGSKKIKASLKKFSNSRRYLNHTAKIRYFSSNRAVATVNAKGKVTGVAPGTCTVYAVAENGLRKGVKITVK